MIVNRFYDRKGPKFMGKYNKKHKNRPKSGQINKCHSINLFGFLIVFVIMIVSFGYSALYATFGINNFTAVMRVQADIRVVGLRMSNSTMGVTSNYEEYSVSSIISSVNLPNSDSTITYDIEILNFGNVEMGITNVTGLPSNLKYEFNNYSLGRILCDDTDVTECTLGSRSTVRMTISYASGMYDSSNTIFPLQIDLTFDEINYVARIDNNYFTKLQLAVNTVPKDDTLTRVVLLKDTAERIDVVAHQNILLDMVGVTISNSGNAPVFETNGSVTMTGGIIYSGASQGAINVNAGGGFVMSGGSIVATGSKQAIYNNGGFVSISGSAYISNSATQRAAVHNHLSTGSMVITGGTIFSSSYSAVLNEAGTLTIGVSDGDASSNGLLIRGLIYGVNNSTGASVPVPTYANYYDGMIIGKKAAFFNEEYINEESGYGIVHEVSYVDAVAYDVARLAIVAVVTFDPGEGAVDEERRNVEKGHQIGMLPVPTRNGYSFDGWFTSSSGGTKVVSSTIVDNDLDLFAHWTDINEVYVAEIGNTQYRTLASAVSAVSSNNSATTITLTRDVIENISIPSGKYIIFDIQSHTLSSPNDSAVIINKGKTEIISGTIMTSSRSTAAINNESSGVLIMSGGSVVARGQRQAIYNDGGKVTISGSAYLEATTGVRATVQNHASSGSIVITGGSIVSVNYSGVYNEFGNLFVGEKDGNINVNTPTIIGKDYGIINAATFKFYDGTFKGVTGAISGNVNELEDNSSITYLTEVINNKTYNIAFLS